MAANPGESHRRLDQFVDAAFAFAVTLLLITGSAPPDSLADLRAALPNIPASAAAFVLIVLFWSAHRAFGRLAPARDAISVVVSLAIVFTVLVYVYPLRFLMQSMFGWISGGWLPGRDLIDGLGDLATLYQVYGLGFALLSGLYAILFARCMKIVATAEARLEAHAWRDSWAICGASGVLSAVLALLPLEWAPWLPPMAYNLIPLAIWIRGRLTAAKAAKMKPAEGTEAPAPA